MVHPYVQRHFDIVAEVAERRRGAVRYGGEDPANKLWSWDHPYPAACWCWCGEVDDLRLVEGRFFCRLHLP